MDQSLFNIIVGVCGTLGGWVLKTIWESVRDLQIADKSLADKVFSIEILVAGTYVKRMDFDNLRFVPNWTALKTSLTERWINNDTRRKLEPHPQESMERQAIAVIGRPVRC